MKNRRRHAHRCYSSLRKTGLCRLCLCSQFVFWTANASAVAHDVMCCLVVIIVEFVVALCVLRVRAQKCTKMDAMTVCVHASSVWPALLKSKTENYRNSKQADKMTLALLYHPKNIKCNSLMCTRSCSAKPLVCLPVCGLSHQLCCAVIPALNGVLDESKERERGEVSDESEEEHGDHSSDDDSSGKGSPAASRTSSQSIGAPHWDVDSGEKHSPALHTNSLSPLSTGSDRGSGTGSGLVPPLSFAGLSDLKSPGTPNLSGRTLSAGSARAQSGSGSRPGSRRPSVEGDKGKSTKDEGLFTIGEQTTGLPTVKDIEKEKEKEKGKAQEKKDKQKEKDGKSGFKITADMLPAWFRGGSKRQTSPAGGGTSLPTTPRDTSARETASPRDPALEKMQSARLRNPSSNEKPTLGMVVPSMASALSPERTSTTNTTTVSQTGTHTPTQSPSPLLSPTSTTSNSPSVNSLSHSSTTSSLSSTSSATTHPQAQAQGGLSIDAHAPLQDHAYTGADQPKAGTPQTGQTAQGSLPDFDEIEEEIEIDNPYVVVFMRLFLGCCF